MAVNEKNLENSFVILWLEAQNFQKYCAELKLL
jgi:hypothetical protein